MEKFAEFLFVRFSFAVPLRADCMDDFPVPLYQEVKRNAMATTVTIISALVACAVLLRSTDVLSDRLLIVVLLFLYILLWMYAPRPCPFEDSLGAVSRA